jgi:arylsulfatase
MKAPWPGIFKRLRFVHSATACFSHLEFPIIGNHSGVVFQRLELERAKPMIARNEDLFALCLLTALLAGCATVQREPAKNAKPNIVVILADDMGFSDAGCYGGEIATPNIDSLAAGGLRFTDFHNTARCWPSRACILTGYYAQQVNRDNFPGEKNGGANGVRPAWAKLLPEMLKPLGYRSYHSGKWHVDGKVLDGGFDHSYSINDHDRHFNPKSHTLDDKPLPPVEPGSGYFSATATAQHAIDMLQEHEREHAKSPFFLYLAFITPHFPLHAPGGDIALYKDRYTAGWDVIRNERFARIKKMNLLDCVLPPMQPDVWPPYNLSEEKLHEEIGPGECGRAVPWESLTPAQKAFQPVKMSIHAAMIHRMDAEIGRVVAQLKEMNALDNTIILFLSDNGASAEEIIRGDKHDKTLPPGSAGTFLSIGPGWASAANTPFRLHKSWVHEGGISTPLIVQWPRGIAARGEFRRNPGHLVDLAPTILELAGGSMPESFKGKSVPVPPGKSLVPVFQKDGTVSHEYFWWCHDGNRAIRVGDWKLVADHKKEWELYNVAKDRSETHDLAASDPDKVRELKEAWEKHAADFHRDAAN